MKTYLHTYIRVSLLAAYSIPTACAIMATVEELCSELKDLCKLIAARVGLPGDPAAKVKMSLNLVNGFWLEALHGIAGSNAIHGSARGCASRNRCTSWRRHGRFTAMWQALGAACATEAHLADRQLHDPVRRRDVGGSDRLAAELHASVDRQV